MVLIVGGDSIRQFRVMLPDSAIDDAKCLLWRFHVIDIANHIAKEGIFASKEMVCKVYWIAIGNLYSLMNGSHCLTIIPYYYVGYLNRASFAIVPIYLNMPGYEIRLNLGNYSGSGVMSLLYPPWPCFASLVGLLYGYKILTQMTIS